MLGRHTGLIIANTVVGAVLGFVALKVFAVQTGTHAEGLLGQLAFAMGLAGLLSILSDMGLGSAHVKRVSEGRDVGAATAAFAMAKVGLAVLFIALVALAAFVANALGFLQDTPRFAVAIIALHFAFMGLRTVFTATFDGRQEFAKTQAVVLVEHLVRVPATLLFAYAFAGAVLGTGPLAGTMADGGNGLADLVRDHAGELLAATYALGTLASLAAGLFLFRRGYPWGRSDPAILKEYWGFAQHIFVAMAVGTLYVNIDKVLITAFWSPENTGRYFAAQRFSDLIVMVPIAVYTVMFPAISDRFARGERAEVRAAAEAAVRHVSLVVVPMVAVTIALAPGLLSLVLTGEFAPAVPTLRVLALFALAQALLYPYATILHALGKPAVTAKAGIFACALNVVLNLALVPAAGTWGLPFPGLAETGSALATFIAATVQFLWLRHEVRRLEGPIPDHHLLKHLLAGAVMCGLLLALPFTPTATNAPFLVVMGLAALGTAVYLGLLALMREFTMHDLRMYLNIVHPAAMARHASEQIQSRGPGRQP